jgi:hypothetical protein
VTLGASDFDIIASQSIVDHGTSFLSRTILVLHLAVFARSALLLPYESIRVGLRSRLFCAFLASVTARQWSHMAQPLRMKRKPAD